jgi:uncharacterized protein YkwD
MVIVLFWSPAPPVPAQQSRPLPIYPQAKVSRQQPIDTNRAYKLYQLARSENPGLRWDSCLASKAILRARRMEKRGYFDHEDPRTGKNPAWELVSQCVPANKKRTRVPAGENLAKGIDTPENIHNALMESPTHRKNILDPRFNRIGVGCYDRICVELFAGV